MKNKINIAIDGPSGVGKTVMAKMLAKELNYKFISSGNLYRAIAYNSLIKNIDLNNEQEINNSWNFNDLFITEDEKIFLNNEDITLKIREDKVSLVASLIAKFQSVRIKVNEFIQNFGNKNKGIIVDGRDATYRILPDAEAKFFLWATPEIRAKRRQNQNLLLGIESNYDEILESIKLRDYNDINRDIDPLIVSEGSVKIDSTNMSVEENFQVMLKEVKKRLK
ncbi:(d)CMP kinase [Mycoplasmopsis arginini]|uniref:Cytidylate kinase n=1 Tax=Mycoplasmopsis arginini TaxID=2094 RepID=A0AA43QXN6_MYCAR|nr:(d)CMP kinase [Mycoplasmopsis arginini]ENY69940.1 Cytidylate kinase [Mycoplasmopsis arginini 7264]MCY2902882.1 (d)CMP kinase [Mycoplasmopsis arginini QMP CG1-2758]MDI3348157.1 (d)CMP kinase [Mycoplasmopsis arginini]MDI3349065.1 (d)CMP kinase [Mycoplasmopsis arginini]MDI3349879.1 (d)CMP kinase [Mycoplasmopsis arginini]